MSIDIHAQLARLRASASTLNGLADQATRQIRAVSEFLSAQGGLGLEYVHDEVMNEGREEISPGVFVPVKYKLAYCRHDEGAYDLAVRAEHEQVPGEWITLWIRPLTGASRTLRIVAIAQLPRFLERLASVTEALVSAVKDEVDAASRVLEQLKLEQGKVTDASAPVAATRS